MRKKKKKNYTELQEWKQEVKQGNNAIIHLRDDSGLHQGIVVMDVIEGTEKNELMKTPRCWVALQQKTVVPFTYHRRVLFT